MLVGTNCKADAPKVLEYVRRLISCNVHFRKVDCSLTFLFQIIVFPFLATVLGYSASIVEVVECWFTNFEKSSPLQLVFGVERAEEYQVVYQTHVTVNLLNWF